MAAKAASAKAAAYGGVSEHGVWRQHHGIVISVSAAASALRRSWQWRQRSIGGSEIS